MAGWRTWGLQMYNQEVRMEMGVGREVQEGEKEGGGGSWGGGRGKWFGKQWLCISMII